MTKQFTAMLVMQLVEEGKIKLEQTISDYLPYYRKDIGKQITIHQLLTHTHGITELPDDMLPIFISEPIEDAIKTYFSQDLEFPPGSEFQYSGLGGYVILGAILEKVTGKTYETLLTERILKPLNMKNTVYLNYHTIIKNRASDYRDMYKGMIHRIQPYPVHANGASSIVTTVDDLSLWDQALYSEKLTSRKYLDLIFTPHVKPESRPYQYGYGWYIEDFDLGGLKKRVLLHTGGSVCIIVRDVDERHTVILLQNVRSLSNREEICADVMKILYDRPYALPKKPIRVPLLKTILEKNVESAIAQYNDLKNRFSQIYNLEELELNFLGYRLLELDKIEDAIEIFKLNTQAFPASSRVYENLGEAYMKQGNHKLAIENYKKSLDLNPGNTSVIDMLKRLEK
jgi:CubicO group peptidase (beta-lactamase class C family)